MVRELACLNYSFFYLIQKPEFIIIFYIALKKNFNMKTAGWVLIVIGIIMILIKGFSIPVEKKVIDIGPVQVNKTENKWIGWPTYAGGILALIGVVLVVADKRK